MNVVVGAVAACLFNAPRVVACKESFSTAEFTVECDSFASLDENSFVSILSGIGHCDWSLSVYTADTDTPYTLSSDDKEGWTHAIHELKGSRDTTNASLTMVFTKNASDAAIPIFDADAFIEWICELSIPELIDEVGSLMRQHAAVVLWSPSFGTGFETRFFRFAHSPSASSPAVFSIADRSRISESRREAVASDWDSCCYPEDFILTPSANDKLESAFSKVANFLAAISIADSSTKALEFDGFVLKVKGYRLQIDQLRWDVIPVALNQTLIGLYKWVYGHAQAGPLTDRLGLARNFVSLHWQKGLFGLDPRVVAAVHSGYELYLKKNLKDYVDVRTKVTSFIIEIEGKAAKSLESAIGNLEKNFYGLVTFVVSFVLLRALQNPKLVGAFSEQTAYLAYALLGISFLHALFCKLGVNQEMNRADGLFMELRSQYEVFFTPADFDIIFGRAASSKGANRDTPTPLLSTRKYVNGRMGWILLVWITSLMAIGAVVYVLTE